MTTLLDYISKPSKKPIFRGFFNVLKHIKDYINFKEKEEYKPIKMNIKTTYPDNYNSNVFAYLEKEYQGRIMKRFKD